jgi:hypothetical protein
MKHCSFVCRQIDPLPGSSPTKLFNTTALKRLHSSPADQLFVNFWSAIGRLFFPKEPDLHTDEFMM